MVKLGFDMRGHAFKAGLDVLRAGYASASQALTADIERVKAEAAAYEASDEFIGEIDEEGNRLWEQDQILSMQQETAEEALQALRKAYALVLYHHWERAIRGYTDSGKSAKHDQLTERAEKKSIPLHVRLGAVRDLANALKHDKGQPLQQSWPAVLSPRSRSHEPRSWYEAVYLEDAHVAEAFEIVEQSGPAIHP